MNNLQDLTEERSNVNMEKFDTMGNNYLQLADFIKPVTTVATVYEDSKLLEVQDEYFNDFYNSTHSSILTFNVGPVGFPYEVDLGDFAKKDVTQRYKDEFLLVPKHTLFFDGYCMGYFDNSSSHEQLVLEKRRGKIAFELELPEIPADLDPTTLSLDQQYLLPKYVWLWLLSNQEAYKLLQEQFRDRDDENYESFGKGVFVPLIPLTEQRKFIAKFDKELDYVNESYKVYKFLTQQVKESLQTYPKIFHELMDFCLEDKNEDGMLFGEDLAKANVMNYVRANTLMTAIDNYLCTLISKRAVQREAVIRRVNDLDSVLQDLSSHVEYSAN